MKKIALAASLALVATAAFGSDILVRPIVNSSHDLSATSDRGKGYTDTNHQNSTDQICVFCHTPHNPLQAIPLWNRYNATVTALYTASPTLTNEVKNNAVLASDSISLFCMSCHDGVTKVGSIKNLPSLSEEGRDEVGVQDKTLLASEALGSANGFFGKALGPNNDTNRPAKFNLSQNLSNSHPIGFNYKTAYEEEVASGFKGLNSPTEVRGKMGLSAGAGGAIFFKSGTGTDQMECASCHKVHDQGLGNFLRIENGRSNLCLACHNK